jgi:hypothetical protein
MNESKGQAQSPPNLSLLLNFFAIKSLEIQDEKKSSKRPSDSPEEFKTPTTFMV